MNYELKIKDFRDLNAWKEGHKVVLMIYELTKIFPKEELFGLTKQLRRAAVSVTSNIAEGFSRRSYRDKSNFYTMALGSLTEIQNQLAIAVDVNFIKQNKFEEVSSQISKTSKIINGLIKKTRTFIDHDS